MTPRDDFLRACIKLKVGSEAKREKGKKDRIDLNKLGYSDVRTFLFQRKKKGLKNRKEQACKDDLKKKNGTLHLVALAPSFSHDHE